jgi:hypothetical protein
MSRPRKPVAPVDSDSEESDLASESESESESEIEAVKAPPRRTLYKGKKAAAKVTAKPVAQPKSSASTSPPRGILRGDSPSKGTSVRFGGKTSNRLQDFFKGALKIIEQNYVLADESQVEKQINTEFREEGLATRINESRFELNLKDVPLLTEDKIKNVILGILRGANWKKPDHYSAISKINSLAKKYQINAYLVPLTEGDFWCECD